MAAKKAAEAGWALTVKKGALILGIGYGGYCYRSWWRVGETLEMDGSIRSWMLNGPGQRQSVIPNEFEEALLARDTCKTDRDLVCSTAALFGDNGSLYRRMDMDYKSKDYSPLPFQTLIRCKNDIDEDGDGWASSDCVPDYTHQLPLYQRLMCQPLVIAEKCIGILKPEEPARALVVGLGGGAWVGFLQELYPHMEIDVVEVEPVVYEHAKKHFGFVPSDKTNVTIGDGEAFLKKRAKEAAADPEKKYDVAFVDCYTTGDPPPMMDKLSFYQDLDDVMKEKSTLGIHLNTRDDANFRAWQTANWQFGNRGCTFRYTPAATLGASVMFSSKGWKVSDPLDMANLRLVYLSRQWSFDHNLPFDAGKRIIRSASAGFPGLPQRYHATRKSLEESEKRKENLRNRT